MKSVIECENICKKYGKKYVLDNLSLKVEYGDIYGLIGVNGAGKTTFLKSILGIVSMDSGNIKLFGNERNEISCKRVGCMIEMSAFYSGLSAKQNLEYYKTLFGVDDKVSVEMVLEMVGLDPNSKKIFKKFSVGMKQRLGIALAIMNEPELIILDEPLNGLDPLGIATIRELIIKLNKEKNITFLISSHNLPELELIANKFGIIHSGEIKKNFSAEELSTICRKGHKIILGKGFNLKQLYFESVLLLGNELICAGDVQVDDVMNELTKKDIKVKEIMDYEMTLEDYFRICIKEEKE